ncbi:MAG: PRTRC system protein E [Candidatus Angelobacter sp.]
MFQELMPLLVHRILVLTLSRVSAEEICVNVIPRPLQAGDKDDNSALATPLSISGTPQELDQELPKQLMEFVGAHLELSSTLKTAKDEMAATAKSAKDAARKVATTKSNAISASGASRGTINAGPDMAAADNSPAMGLPGASTPATGSLFEAAASVKP